jgi:thiol-disulfide isomerase/thioredoxin
MGPGAWVLVAAVVAALAAGAGWSMTNGTFRGTHQVRGRVRGRATSTEPDPSQDRPAAAANLLAGTAYDARRGERATLLQFSSAFCAPCRATRRTLADVARAVPGVAHVEVDAEQHLDLVRSLGVVRTPTTLVLDAAGREITRASGAPRPGQVLAALERGLVS